MSKYLALAALSTTAIAAAEQLDIYSNVRVIEQLTNPYNKDKWLLLVKDSTGTVSNCTVMSKVGVEKQAKSWHLLVEYID